MESKKKNTKFALWGIGDPLIPNKNQDKIRKFVAKKSDAFIFYSEINKKKYIDWGINPNKLFVAKNSIDINSIFEFVESYPSNKLLEFKKKNRINSFTILSVGRLIERKRNEWLLEAASLLINKGYKLHVVIIGNGPEYESLKKISENYGISQNTTFTGKLVGISNLGPWHLGSDVIVAAGQIGHLATEAHAYEKPLILSDCKSCKGPEAQILIPNETGLFYKHGNIENLAQQIESLIVSKAIRQQLSSKSKQRAIEFAGTRIMVNGFIHAISKLTEVKIKEV